MDITSAVRRTSQGRRRGAAVVLIVGGLVTISATTLPASQTPRVAPRVEAPQFDPSIDPAAPAGALWTLTNPTAGECGELRQRVMDNLLAPEAVFDPKAPCQRSGLNSAAGWNWQFGPPSKVAG